MTNTQSLSSGWDKRLFWVLLFTVVLAFYFWTGSRYPDLGEKASMAGELELRGISFDSPYPVDPNDPAWKQVWDETRNWIVTNKKGMLFGLAFATCLMTFFSLLPSRGPRSGFGNALIGTILGTPLGVCVNCATPIAKGTHEAGSRLELSLALLLSSPTLNIIVLTMMISLLPWYMVATKLVLSMGIILIGVPLICRSLAKDARGAQALTEEAAGPKPLFRLNPSDSACPVPGANTWLRSLWWTLQDLVRNGWRICVITVPMMLLAGFLGAILTTLLPWEMLVNNLPVGSIPLVLAAMIGVALLGTLLPVPMSFDVILVAILLSAGMPIHYVMVLFFTLGLFSIYPYLVIHRRISRSVAGALFATVAVCGVAGGIIVHFTDNWWNTRHLNNVIAELKKLPPAQVVDAGNTQLPASDAATVRQWLRLPSAETIAPEDGAADGIAVERFPFNPRSGTAKPGFTRINGAAVGLDVPALWYVGEYLYFLDNNRCVASGDIHHDGWPDLVVGGDNGLGGIYLFANRNGETFERQKLDLGSLAAETVAYLALVDLNNDGWLDLFFTTFNEGNYVMYNQNGFFDDAKPELLPSPRRSHTMAAGFADFDRDGELEMLLGNWALGPLAGNRRRTSRAAANLYVDRIAGEFNATPMPAFGGETLSILFTDLNQDSRPDIIVGNDFGPADVIYLQTTTGGMNLVKAQDEFVPHTTGSTMSISSADIDNDLSQEIYFAQISMGADRRKFYRSVPLDADIWTEDPAVDRATLQTQSDSMELFRRVRQKPAESRTLWDEAKDMNERRDLVALVAAQMRKNTETKRLERAIPDHMKDLKRIFDRNRARTNGRKYEQQFDPVEQIKGTNVLLQRDATGKFQDRAGELGLGIAGWAWNAKFADLDLDEWQDLYVANGFETSKYRESNYFFRNLEGRSFVDETQTMGLTDHFTTGAYTYCDYDQDGDLDIISIPNSAPIRIWRNDSTAHHSIVVELRDTAGNHFGIGSRVYIHYGDGRHQMREIQASGGFHSADAPLAHFGLGQHQTVDRIVIEWSNGGRTVWEKPLAADSRYVFHRQNRPATDPASM